MMKMVLPTAELIEREAAERGLTIAALCRRADIDAATFHRWKKGTASPTIASVQKLLDALVREPNAP